MASTEMSDKTESPSMSDHLTALIPAAGRVPEGVLALSNIASPAMIPVAGRPVIHWTLSYLRELGIRKAIIAVPQRGLFIEDFVDCAFGADLQVEFIVPSRDGGLGFTVRELAARATTDASLVVLGDTYFQLADRALLSSPDPTVLVQPVEDSYRWCIARTDARGFVTELRDKEPDLTGDLAALIGVYYFPSTQDLRTAVDAAVKESDEAGRARTEMARVLEKLRAATPIRTAPAGDWLDVGNPDRQAASHRRLLQTRAFNELEVDATFGTITKRSRHVEKFLDEINYLRTLPKDLAVLFPRVLDYSVEWDNPHLTMEYYGYPSLAEAFVFENIDAGIWQRVFEHLRDIVQQGFGRYRRPLARGSLRQMYVDKTRTRLHKVNNAEPLASLVRAQGAIEINGRSVVPLGALWPKIERAVEDLEANAMGAIIHGDLCLSNILYDFRSRIVKLIDPRGSFGGTGIYGDPRYDIAKLYHSVYGLYDFITNDLFKIEVDGTNVKLDLRERPPHRAIRTRFEQVFFPLFNRREVLLITALLFASMVPLHSDAPRRQLAMYARALQLFDEYFQGEGA